MASQYQGGSLVVETPNLESSRSGVSWSAVFAGGVAASGISLILLMLGMGLGFASISPWAGDSMSAAGLAVTAGIWIVVVQWLASVVGGYVAGRLRTKWADHHSDEVFFRDTAHGFLSWGVATMLAIAFTAFAGLTAIGGAATGVGAAAGVAADSSAYSLDQLFRTDPAEGGAAEPAAPGAPAAPDAAGAVPDAATAPDATTAAPAQSAQSTAASPSAAPAAETAAGADEALRAESGRLLERAVLGTGDDADRDYLAQLVSRQSGLSQEEAEQRVDQVTAAAKQAADEARRASAYAAIITALSLLVGAFIAAAAGALGGRHRDELATARV